MTNLEARQKIFTILHDDWFTWTPDSVEALYMAMEALREPKQPDSVGTTDDRKLAKVLADTLDGTPLLYACDKLWSEHGWCEEHCKPGQQEPDAECWMKYAEVMANEQ